MLVALPFVFLAGIIGALATFPWRDADARRRIPLLFLMFVPPVAAFAWGILFAVPANPATPERPIWITGFLVAMPLLAIAIPFALVPTMRGARAFTVCLGAVLFVITAGLSLLATMQVTGAWI